MEVPDEWITLTHECNLPSAFPGAPMPTRPAVPPRSRCHRADSDYGRFDQAKDKFVCDFLLFSSTDFG